MLPDEPDGLAGLESRLAAGGFNDLRTSVAPTDVDVSLPKFEIRTAVSLSDALKALGMPDAFDEDAANFSGIADPAETGENLHIDAAIHQGWVRVDERGTEAAGATAVVESTDSASIPEPFVADHPFAFAIRHVRTGAILFYGHVADPSVEAE